MNTEPKFKPGQEVRGKLDCYRILLDADERGYDVETFEGDPPLWAHWDMVMNVVHSDTVLRRTPDPPKPIEGWVVVNAVGGLNCVLYACESTARGSNPSADRIVHLREVDPDTVTVPRAVVEELLECYKTNPYASLHGVRRYFAQLAEAAEAAKERP